MCIYPYYLRVALKPETICWPHLYLYLYICICICICICIYIYLSSSIQWYSIQRASISGLLAPVISAVSYPSFRNNGVIRFLVTLWSIFVCADMCLCVCAHACYLFFFYANHKRTFYSKSALGSTVIHHAGVEVCGALSSWIRGYLKEETTIQGSVIMASC